VIEMAINVAMISIGEFAEDREPKLAAAESGSPRGNSLRTDSKAKQAAQTRPDMATKTSQIRRAVPGDADMVQRLSAEAYIPAYMSVLGTIPKPATEDYRPRIESGEVWILEIEGEPIGIAVLEGNTEHLLIYSIAVKPDAQRKGYGRALLDFADKRAIELGLHEVRLYTNERMERNLMLYRRHGFVEVGRRPHPSRPAQVLVDMVRRLRSRDSASAMRTVF
jgi:ribosomal protein S18 acetylase RimI-like enzyme